MLKLNKKGLTLRNSRGFTLIELLVVIAIIGILASIVLVSLNDARNKGYDTQVKSDASQIRNAMEICYDDNSGSYASCNTLALLGLPATLVPPSCSDDNAGGYNIITTASKYTIWADLCAASNDWCVDNTGIAKITGAAVGAGATECP